MADFEIHTREIADRFDHGMLALTFGALALSIQFSPAMGVRLPWLLIMSWMFLLSSGFVGGWRLLYIPVANRANIEANRAESEVKRLRDPQLQISAAYGAKDERGNRVTPEILDSWINSAEKNHKHFRAETIRISKWFPVYFQFQMWTFFVGVVGNTVFAAINFYARIH